MDTKTGLYITLAFIGGGALGAAAAYVLTKKVCEDRAHEAFETMKERYDKKIKECAAKIEEEKDAKKVCEDKEEEIVKIDKPSISEMASIIDSDSHNNSIRTHYATVSSVKQNIRDIVEAEPKEKEQKKEQVIIDYIASNESEFEDYSEKNFTFNVDTESWNDWESDIEYSPDDLPFEVDDVVWDDNDQCYIADRGTKSLYILEKV